MPRPIVSSATETRESETVYLCQVSETVSCGACCGLYNIGNLSRDNLEAMLAARTEAFVSVPRTEDGLYAFKKEVERRLPKEKPFPEFHHCPYLGLVGPNQSRVGCLLHPLGAGNEGKDFRWLSWYGAMACRIYFCPTGRRLPPAYRMIVRTVMDHWYFYGLIVTEHRLLAAYFKEVARRICRNPVVSDFTDNPVAAGLFREFAALKIHWPYRRKNAPGPCHHVFDNGEYPRTAVQWPDPSVPISTYGNIFHELESGFSSTEALRQAEWLLDDLFEKTVLAIGIA